MQLSARDRRLEEAFAALQRDRLEVTYEAPLVRKLEERLAAMQAAPSPDPEPEAAGRQAEAAAQLAALRAAQGVPGNLTHPSPNLPVLLCKPTAEQRARLELLEKKVLAAWCARVMEEDEPLIVAQLQEAARTTLLTGGRETDEGSVKDSLRALFSEHLLRLEGRDEPQIEAVDDLDPELEFTEEEEKTLSFSDALEGAELAAAILTAEQRKEEKREGKRQALIARRRAERDRRAGELAQLKTFELIRQIARIEVMQRAILGARVEQTDLWLLACVRDPKKPQTAVVRGQQIVKGWGAYFSDLAEVAAIRESEDLSDFYRWLVEQKNRLDFLTEGDLYALSAYAPFRDAIEPLLGLRRDMDPVAAVFGP